MNVRKFPKDGVCLLSGDRGLEFTRQFLEDMERKPDPVQPVKCSVCGKLFSEHARFEFGNDGRARALFKLCRPTPFVDLDLGYMSEDEAAVERLGVKVW